MTKLVKIKSGRQWGTQTAAVARFKNLLHRYSNGDVIDAKTDIDDLTGLLATYDDARSPGEPPKAGNGIHHFKRMNNSGPSWSLTVFRYFVTTGVQSISATLKPLKARQLSK